MCTCYLFIYFQQRSSTANICTGQLFQADIKSLILVHVKRWKVHLLKFCCSQRPFGGILHISFFTSSLFFLFSYLPFLVLLPSLHPLSLSPWCYSSCIPPLVFSLFLSFTLSRLSRCILHYFSPSFIYLLLHLSSFLSFLLHLRWISYH